MEAIGEPVACLGQTGKGENSLGDAVSGSKMWGWE